MNDSSLHTTTGKWRLGIYLALTAVVVWGFLPIALSRMLVKMDPVTITWYRFLVAGIVFGLVSAKRGGFLPLARGGRAVFLLLAVASVCLTANYLLYIFSLRYVPPSTAQVLIQLAPMFLLLGSFVAFHERFGHIQWTGLAMLLVGLALFFDEDILQLFSGGGPVLTGTLLLLGAAAVWGCYALAQKQLLATLSSTTVMAVVCLAAAAMLSPLAAPSSAIGLAGAELALLGFLAANTLIAYGSFAESLQHLEASRVGMVMTLTPVITIAAVTVGARALPSLFRLELLSPLSLLGAALVVSGSMLGAAGRRQNRRRTRRS